MKQHDLKIWPQYFQAVLEGRKTFEMRRDDRGYQVGDSLRLREWDQVLCQHTGRELVRTVTYCLHGGNFGLAEGWVVMGLAAAEQPVARFTGAHGGRWTFAMLDPAAVPHDGMALYAGPAAQPAVKESLTTAAVPDGYALVPVEPTAEMIAAGWFNGDMACAIGHALAYADSVRDYKAMLAAQRQGGER